MKLKEKLTQSLTVAIFNTYDLKDLKVSTIKANKEIRDDLIEELEDLSSEETKRARLDFFKVRGAIANDYTERCLKISDEKEFIYGIRNMGGNPEIPFIQITPNFEINSKDEALRIYELIKHEFQIFSPLYLSFNSSKKVDADFYGSIHMVASIDALLEKEPWPDEDQISFEAINNDSYYEWYQNGYKEFHEETPNLKARVTLNSLCSMEDSLEQGLLKYAIFEGERIGIIAGERSNFLGHTGVYFHEIYISKKWKGRGHAKLIQRKFIEIFCHDLNFVWGTIDSENLPSYKTAFSNGRRPIRYECFINLKSPLQPITSRDES